jgi:hypothetical protein
MHLPHDTTARGAVSSRQAWVCVVLVLLLLYNPFLMTSRSDGGLNVRHPASNRATVGSSELQHFSPIAGKDRGRLPDLAVAEVFAAPPSSAGEGSFGAEQTFLPSSQFPPASLWFRPPPSL